jgi:anti-sigma B factor antagonist
VRAAAVHSAGVPAAGAAPDTKRSRPARGTRIPVTGAFNIEVVSADEEIRVRLEGELDVATAPALDEALVQAEASGATTIVIDLTRVSFIDSTGLRALLEASARDQRSAVSGRLQITRGAAQPEKLFRLAGVLNKLPFVAAPADD